MFTGFFSRQMLAKCDNIKMDGCLEKSLRYPIGRRVQPTFYIDQLLFMNTSDSYIETSPPQRVS